LGRHRIENEKNKEPSKIMVEKYEKMLRVSKNSLCPVCGKPDWCLVAEDDSAAICQRIQESSVKQCGDAGWLHVLSYRHNRPLRHKHCANRRLSLATALSKQHLMDFVNLSQQYQRWLTADKLGSLSASLGVSTTSLKRLCTGWDGEAYTFPMSDTEGQIIGIRRRFPDGRKLSVAGCKNGLFIPIDLLGSEPLLITEGPTDCASALDLGFEAIARPNCNSKVAMTVKYSKGRSVVVISDGDTAGRNGTDRLINGLILHCFSVKVIYPPSGIKDLRQWLWAGLNVETFKGIIEKTKAIEIKISMEV
jgi:hypothetical protein